MVPCIIPFDDAGEIDGQKLHRFICWLVEKGVHSLFPFGTFGGGPLLDAKEKQYAAEIIIEAVDGRIPVVFHVAGENTRSACTLAKHLQRLGAAALASVPPLYYKFSPEAVRSYYQALLDVAEVPVFAYNFPAAVGYGLSPEQVAELAAMGIAGIKDSSNDLNWFVQAMNTVADDKFTWFTGNTPLLVPAALMGAHGCTAASANSFPEFTVEVWQATVLGDFELAAKLQKRLTALTALQNQGLPMATVYAMTFLRGIDIGLPRAPIQAMGEESRRLLENNLRKLKFLEKRQN